MEKNKFSKILSKINEYIPTVVFLGIPAILIYFMSVGKYNLYISKMLNGYAYFSITICLLLFAVSFIKDPKTREEQGCCEDSCCSEKQSNGEILWTIFAYTMLFVLIIWANGSSLSPDQLAKKIKKIPTNTSQISQLEEKEFELEIKAYYDNYDIKDKFNPQKPDQNFLEKISTKNIAYDKKTRIWYVDNVIYVFFKNDINHEDVVKYAKEHNLEVMGQILQTNTAFYRFPEPKTLEQLYQYILESNQDPDIYSKDICYPSMEAVNYLESNIQKSPEDLEKIAGEYIKDNKVTVTKENYTQVIDTIYRYPQVFEGKQIQIQGKIFKDENMPQGLVGIGMWQMWCCAMDMTLVGMLVSPNGHQIDQSGWYDVEGTINIQNNEPYIQIEKATSIPEPHDKFVD